MNKIDLSGHCAAITGGAQGIGKAIAERLLLSGAQVALWDLDEQALKAAAAELSSKGRVHIQRVDVTDAGGMELAAEESASVLGKLDILVASAGIAGPNFKTWSTRSMPGSA